MGVKGCAICLKMAQAVRLTWYETNKACNYILRILAGQICAVVADRISPISDKPSGNTEFDRAWKVLLSSFAAATAYTLAAIQWPVLSSFPVFTWVGLPSASAWGWQLSPSLGYVGQGMIMGPRSAISMLLGATAGQLLRPFLGQSAW